MKAVVTGAAGFIGSNLVSGLNNIGIDDVIAVDDLSVGNKFRNLVDLRISDYFDQQTFYDLFSSGALGDVDVVFHEGACSDTMEHDGRFMLDNNYRCSKGLLDACIKRNVRLIYASSASVYGAGDVFVEQPPFERPLNVYGYSKLLFDQVVRQTLPTTDLQVAGLRYFNVYGPREDHKGRMASVAYHHFMQCRENGTVKLFGEYGGYGPGAQVRDFVFVDDVVAVNLWLLANPHARGIFNVGTGRAQPFNDVALSVVNLYRLQKGTAETSLQKAVAEGHITYVPFPVELKGRYQCYTQADITALRNAGCRVDFADVETGVRKYAHWLRSTSA